LYLIKNHPTFANKFARETKVDESSIILENAKEMMTVTVYSELKWHVQKHSFMDDAFDRLPVRLQILTHSPNTAHRSRTREAVLCLVFYPRYDPSLFTRNTNRRAWCFRSLGEMVHGNAVRMSNF